VKHGICVNQVDVLQLAGVGASGSQARTYGTFKSATLADGSEITLRQSTTKGFAGIPTLEFRDTAGDMVVKIRY
jgi:hypothetical protein